MKKAPPGRWSFALDSLFLFGGADSDREGFCATRAAHGMLALLARQAQRCLTSGAIAEYVCIGVLIAVMSAEQAAHPILKGAPFGVLGLTLVDLARHDSCA